MQIDTTSGLLDQARYAASPNQDLRPDPTDINLLVIHNISLPPGDFSTDSVEAFFQNRLLFDEHPYFDRLRDLRVSAHLFLRRDARLIQFVPFDRRAWHAGASSFRGRVNCNDFSIGIELEGEDNLSYEDCQYQALSRIVISLMGAYPGINQDRICGHNDIAPGRKTDPGPAFDWPRFFSDLQT